MSSVFIDSRYPLNPESEVQYMNEIDFFHLLLRYVIKRPYAAPLISIQFTIPILSVGLTGEGTSLSWYNRLFSTAVNPRKGFKITPARKALESSGPDVNARSRTLPNLD